MTTEEKLAKAIEFIKKIEKLDLNTTDIGTLIHVCGQECEECGSDDVYCEIEGDDIEVILPKEIDDLKDKAWHLLADIDAL